MKIVKMKGGLGNQMFQYAYAKLLSKNANEEVKLDYSAYDALDEDSIRKPRIIRFNIELTAALQDELQSVCIFKHTGNSLSFRYKVMIFLENMLNKRYFLEKNRAYIEPKLIEHIKYYDGYWQSWKYVYEVLDELLTEFLPTESLSKKTMGFLENIKKQNAVFVGVRKGDYSLELEHYGVYDSTYYQHAMGEIEKRVDNPVFYIFSNDISWCKNNLDFNNHDIIYREPEDQTDDFEELMLMASCKHAIIVNSTYNWWGATLIKNPNKVICCPTKWFFNDVPIDIIPPAWLRISV